MILPAVSGQTIPCQDMIYIGSFDMYRDIAVTIEGGYNCNYTNVTGITTIKGNMNILEGANTLMDVEVVP